MSQTPASGKSLQLPITFINMKRQNENDSSSSDEESELVYETKDEEINEPEEESVQVDFDFCDPKDEHYSSVKRFVSNFIPLEHFQASEFADIITSQIPVGTMIGVEGESDVYGFITALNLSRYGKFQCIAQIKEYLLSKCPESSRLEFGKVLESDKTALVINERMVNLPYQLVPVLHDALHEDIKWAVENEQTQELKDNYNCTTFITVSKTSCTVKTNGKSKKTAKVDTSGTMYFNFEDEFVQQHASLSFSFPKPAESVDEATNVQKDLVVMVISREEHQAVLSQFSNLV